MFYENQPHEAKETYKEYLKSMASLTRLFSGNTDAYIDSRVAENLFCKAFDAKNSARDDSTADACKDGIGIGIKTFIHSRKSLQKVAEFNKIRQLYAGKSAKEIIEIIAEARNERIRTTKEIYGLSNLIYHCVTRKENNIYIFEQVMEPITNIKWDTLKDDTASISFNDEFHHYSFNKSKSVLQMHFELETPVDMVKTTIIDKPIDSLIDYISKTNKVIGKNVIYLPLYTKHQTLGYKELAEKSGLNQWNAGGRKRHSDEVYIPIPDPTNFRTKFPEFFIQDKKHKFVIELPNGDTIPAKLCQQNLKAIMSHPNKLLGKWLLRDVLNLKEKQLVTRALLNKLNIDSVSVEKVSNEYYKIDFASCGKFEEFKEQYLS